MRSAILNSILCLGFFANASCAKNKDSDVKNDNKNADVVCEEYNEEKIQIFYGGGRNNTSALYYDRIEDGIYQLGKAEEEDDDKNLKTIYSWSFESNDRGEITIKYVRNSRQADVSYYKLNRTISFDCWIYN